MKRQALVIGINRYPFLKNYKGETLHLQAPYHDATSIADLLDRPQENPELAWSVTRLLSNKETSSVVSADQLQDAIRELFQPKTQKPPEVALLFFAGHGLRRDSDGKVFLAHSSAKPRTDEWGFPLDELRQLMQKSPIPHQIDQWGFPLDELRQLMQESPIPQQIVWLDCCHSGDLLNFTSENLKQWKLGGNRLIVAACRDDREAMGVRSRGILTEALLQGLQPEREPIGNWISSYSLIRFLDRQIDTNPLLRQQIPLHHHTGTEIRFWQGKGEGASLPTSTLVWWKSLCQQRLEQQHALSSKFITGIAPKIEDVYVPLGLVERKRESRRLNSDNPDAAQGSALYQETEITRQFQHNEFLEQVLRRGDSPKSKGKRLVILGEPGAGKTTLLQQASCWVAAEIENAVTLWVSLADLQGRSLEDYLLEVWLRDAVRSAGKASVTETDKNDFVGQFHQGRVWLFLDGADEMAANSGNPLFEIDNQIRNSGLLGKARILLTCRLNLWDGGTNPLAEFDVYRTLDFDYPTQVEQYIDRWFAALNNEGAVTRGQQLSAALKEPGKERIQDLVKNPLRLTLLCLTWHKRDGKLPDTKAGLYQKFVERFYECQENRFPLTSDEPERLNAALGELAREAIDKELTRFRLRHKFVSKFLKNRKDKRSLFDLALNVGWLNIVGVDADDPDEPVYAFYHASLQEYFAATSIDDRDFFLPRNHVDRPVEDKDNPGKYKPYRIFISQWKEVFLVWLGCQNVADISNKKKLINKLIEFKDSCRDWVFGKGFYEYQAYLLAAAGIAEFPPDKAVDEILADRIVSQIIRWSFGHFNAQQQRQQIEVHPQIAAKAQLTLLEAYRLSETYRALVVSKLIELLASPDKYICIEVAKTLGKIVPKHPKAIAYLSALIDNNPIFGIRHTAAIALAEIDFTNPKVLKVPLSPVNVIIQQTAFQESIKSGTINPYSPEVIDSLIQKVRHPKNPSEQKEAIENLGDTKPGHLETVKTLIEIIERFSQDEEICQKAVRSLAKIGKSDPKAIELLVSLSQNNKNESIQQEAIWGLRYSETNIERVIMVLLDSIYTIPHYFHYTAIHSIEKLVKKSISGTVVSALKKHLPVRIQNEKDFDFYQKYYQLLWYCAQNISYLDFHQAWQIHSPPNPNTRE